MNDFVRQASMSRGGIIFLNYSRKVRWILNDIITYPHFDDEVRKGVKAEIESDAFSVPAISEKIPLLNPEQRQMIEELIEDILAGKTITISIKTEEHEGAADTDKKD
jgi:hypothetical protein